MSTTDEQWWEVHAGEYVLGTLTKRDQDVFDKIGRADSDMQDRILAWQENLIELDQDVRSVVPPTYILPSLLERIHAESEDFMPLQDVNTSQPTADDDSGQLNRSTSSVTGGTVVDITPKLTPADQSSREAEFTSDESDNATSIWKILVVLVVAAILLSIVFLIQRP